MNFSLLIKQNNPELISAALKLESFGYLSANADNFTYLDISDEYIHQLFPLLNNKQIIKPDYFGENLAGAHISVIYPEENKCVDEKFLGEKHYFQVKDLYTTAIGPKEYCVLKVTAPSLLQLRKAHNLSDKLCFKKYWIDFHITIGVGEIKQNY